MKHKKGVMLKLFLFISIQISVAVFATTSLFSENTISSSLSQE